MKTTKDFIKKYGLPTETGKLYLKTIGLKYGRPNSSSFLEGIIEKFETLDF